MSDEDEWDETYDYSYDYEDEEGDGGMAGYGVMHLRYHAGHCCGVKTIEGFYSGPDDSLIKMEAYVPSVTLPGYGDRYHVQSLKESEKEFTYTKFDKSGLPVTSMDRFYVRERPQEPARDRLKAYLDYLKEVRPEGMVDCYLIDTQVTKWHAELTKHGFKAVNRWRNSNSHYYITCYQLCYGQPKKQKKGNVAAPFATAPL
jgi:hypothetical protein